MGNTPLADREVAKFGVRGTTERVRSRISLDGRLTDVAAEDVVRLTAGITIRVLEVFLERLASELLVFLLWLLGSCSSEGRIRRPKTDVEAEGVGPTVRC